jgi:2-dehydropantoate 2-reductase
MKVLVIGRGVVGTIYGWALSKAGIDVSHVVRKEGLPDTDTLDLLDLRPGRLTSVENWDISYGGLLSSSNR